MGHPAACVNLLIARVVFSTSPLALLRTPVGAVMAMPMSGSMSIDRLHHR